MLTKQSNGEYAFVRTGAKVPSGQATTSALGRPDKEGALGLVLAGTDGCVFSVLLLAAGFLFLTVQPFLALTYRVDAKGVWVAEWETNSISVQRMQVIGPKLL